MTFPWKRKLTGSTLTAGIAAAVMIGLSAAPALSATPTWTVKPGGAITAKAGTTILKDARSGLALKCSSSTAKTTLKKGRHLAGAGLGSVTAISFTKCTGPLSLTFTVKPAHLPWKLNAVSYNKKTGVTTGTISGIHATLTGPGCTATVDGTGPTKNNGTVKVTYTNKTHRLAVVATGGNLHTYKVTGCFHQILSGDASRFTASYAVSPSTTITSP